jgi:hypothetical protein
MNGFRSSQARAKADPNASNLDCKGADGGALGSSCWRVDARLLQGSLK